MEFSRFLYERTDVEASFINSLLKRKKSETLFWISELFLSGWKEQTVTLLWQVYYDFYYIYHSKLERKIHTLLTKSTDLKSVMTVATTLYYLKHKTTHCFEMRLLAKKITIPSVNFIYKSIPSKYDIFKNKHFILSIKKKHIINIAYYFQQEGLALCDVYSDVKKLLNLKKFRIHHTNKNIEEHMVMALISKYSVLSKPASIREQSKHSLFHIETSLLKELADVKAMRPYRILGEHRKYEIDDDIGLDHFSLARFRTHAYENSVAYNMYYHWEYYAFKTPLWEERFNKYGGIQNHLIKEVEFPSEEKTEAFYKIYAYDPDEQSSVTDRKSTKSISEISYEKWLQLVFQTD